MKIRPLHDWVIIIETEPEDRTAGGIIIPEVAKEKPQWGVVESAGPGAYETDPKDPKGKKKFVQTEVRQGDRVLYEQYAGKKFTVDGQKVVLVRERSILGTLGTGSNTALQKKEPGVIEKKRPSAVQKKEPGVVETVKKPASGKAKK